MAGEEWFAKTTVDNGVSEVYQNSDVQAFVDAEEYYADLRAEIEITDKESLICWIGFEGHHNTLLPKSANISPIKKFPPRSKANGDETWLDLLSKASDQRDVAIKVLLNLHPKPDLDSSKPEKKYKESNFDLVYQLNLLKNCVAINDFRYLFMNGTHHQKMVLVLNPRGFFAYCGTCDVESSRIDQRWCEVQCKITGDAALKLFYIFKERWNEHSQSQTPAGSFELNIEYFIKKKSLAKRSGNFMIQTATTYGNPSRDTPFVLRSLGNPKTQVVNEPHRLVMPPYTQQFWFGNDFFTEKDSVAAQLIKAGKLQNAVYNFGAKGHTGIYELIKSAIKNTKKSIYLEDQYLVCDEKMGVLDSMLDLLINKVKQETFEKLVIFCTRIDDINDEFLGTGWAHRNRFISALIAAGKEKVIVCQYKNKRDANAPGDWFRGLFYIHSKTWIFDDVYLITGSANCNRRGYSHDSELCIGIYDQNKRFVKDLRVKIWLHRLNVEGIKENPLQESDLLDFVSAANKYWAMPSRFGLPLESNVERSLKPPFAHPDRDVQAYIQGLKNSNIAITNKPIDTLIKIQLQRFGMSLLWDVVVDPDGT